MINFRKEIRVQLCKTIYRLGIIDHYSVFVPFVLCYLHLSTPWAFRRLYDLMIKPYIYWFCYKSQVFSTGWPGSSGNWTDFRIWKL